MNTLEERLAEVFSDVLGRQDLNLSEDLKLKDIEDFDSLVHISLIGAIQDEFGISFQISEIVAMETVGEILQSIRGKMAN